MANYASSVLLAARAKQKELYAHKFEGRAVNSFLADMFLKTRGITIPNLDEIRQATTQATTALYLTKVAHTVDAVKSCSPTGVQGDSGAVSLTWATKSVQVITSAKRHAGNEYKMAESLAWELLMAEQALFKDGTASLEAAILAYLEANRTQVNAISAAGVGINTWDGTNDNVDVAVADIDNFYNSVVSEMQLNNYSGAMDEAFNTTWGANTRTQVNQGEANATNTAYQYSNPFDFTGYSSNLIVPATGDGSTHYIVPEGGVAMLDWNDPLNREGKVSGDMEWGLYESRLFPGLMLDLFTKTACADTSGSAGGTQDFTHTYELALNYALTHQPLSTSTETPIFKYNIKTT